MVLLLVICVLAGTATYYLNHISKRGPVLASSLVALSAGVLLPAFFPQNGYTLALAATCVSYAAMAAKSRIGNLQEMFVCSVLVAVLFSLSTNSLVGVGGRLGTIAAITVVIVWGIKTHRRQWIMMANKYQIPGSDVLRNGVAFLLFIGTGTLLLYQAWQGAVSNTTRILLVLSVTVFAYGLYLHLIDFFKREIFEKSPDNFAQSVWLFPCAVVGTMLTFYLSYSLHLGPVIASGFVGAMAALLLQGPYAVVTYTAVFAGTSAPSLLPSYYHVFFTGVAVWAIYILCRRIYQGFGSRLGTIAAGSVLMVQFITRLIGS